MMIRFKKQFLFLFSFLFKTPTILSQQKASNINFSQRSFSSFSFFLSFFLFSFTWENRRTEACNKVHSLIYYWWNSILSVSLFLFWIHIITIFRKGRRKNSLSCTYLWQGLIFRFLSFTGEWHPHNRLNQHLSVDFCPKILFYSFYRRLFPELAKLACFSHQCLPRTKDSFCRRWTSRGLAANRRLYPPTSVLKLKIYFQISLTKKCHFGAKVSMDKLFDFFLLPTFHPVTIFEWPGFFSLFNRLQVIEYEKLTIVHIFF